MEPLIYDEEDDAADELWTETNEDDLFAEIGSDAGSATMLSMFDSTDSLDEFDWTTPPELQERIRNNLAEAKTAPEVQPGVSAQPDSAISRIGLSNSDKAGMENVDVTRANQIIYEMSKVRFCIFLAT